MLNKFLLLLNQPKVVFKVHPKSIDRQTDRQQTDIPDQHTHSFAPRFYFLFLFFLLFYLFIYFIIDFIFSIWLPTQCYIMIFKRFYFFFCCFCYLYSLFWCSNVKDHFSSKSAVHHHHHHHHLKEYSLSKQKTTTN